MNMAISCTFSRKKCGIILSLLKKVETPNKITFSKLKGIEKSIAKCNISNLGRTQVKRSWVSDTIRDIEQKLHEDQEANTFIIVLRVEVYHLIQRLQRKQRTIRPRHSPRSNSAPP